MAAVGELHLNVWLLKCDHATTDGVIPTDTTDVVNTCPGSHTHKMAAFGELHLEMFTFK